MSRYRLCIRSSASSGKWWRTLPSADSGVWSVAQTSVSRVFRRVLCGSYMSQYPLQGQTSGEEGRGKVADVPMWTILLGFRYLTPLIRAWVPCEGCSPFERN